MTTVGHFRVQNSDRRTVHRPEPMLLIPHIRDLIRTLAGCTESELQAEVVYLRQQLIQGADRRSPEVLVAALSLAASALIRTRRVNLYDVQLQAVIALSCGSMAQMQTGEGKTYVAVATAICLAMEGKGVHVMTPNTYLAERDCALAAAPVNLLGLSVGLTPERGEVAAKRQAYDCDVTYGTGHEFGFDYLRDQLTLRGEAKAGLGSRLLKDLRQGQTSGRTTMQRGLVYAIVDEADSVLIDDAGSPLVLSINATGTAPDLEAHRTACELADALQPEVHFRLDGGSGNVDLTADGMKRCYDADVLVPVKVLVRPWTTYVEQALRARWLFRRNVHYVVQNDEVRIVDGTTGRIFEDRSWQDGLHQAIEVREGLPVTAEKDSAARITRQRFFRLYQNLCGMTGTALGCEDEFRAVYRSETKEIPLRAPSRRLMLAPRYFGSLKAKFLAIVHDVQQRHANGQPVLVGTQSINDSEAVGCLLEQAGLSFHLLNGLQNHEEADIIAAAGQSGAITIATNLAGRGTDISVTPEAMAAGGLHVVVAECQLSSRMDRQLIGRCARQGNPGSAQIYVSAEDSLLKRFGRWLSDAIVREAGIDGETTTDLQRPLIRIQKTAERQQYLSRMELLRQDIARDSLSGAADQWKLVVYSSLAV